MSAMLPATQRHRKSSVLRSVWIAVKDRAPRRAQQPRESSSKSSQDKRLTVMPTSPREAGQEVACYSRLRPADCPCLPYRVIRSKIELVCKGLRMLDHCMSNKLSRLVRLVRRFDLR